MSDQMLQVCIRDEWVTRNAEIYNGIVVDLVGVKTASVFPLVLRCDIGKENRAVISVLRQKCFGPARVPIWLIKRLSVIPLPLQICANLAGAWQEDAVS